MKTLYALVIVCFSVQALAFDLGTNSAIAVDSFMETAQSVASLAYNAEESLIELAYDYDPVHEWETETTASIPSFGSIEPAGYEVEPTAIVAAVPF